MVAPMDFISVFADCLRRSSLEFRVSFGLLVAPQVTVK
jgi:hypothetical protein